MIDLRLGDCLKILKTLPDGCVDAVVTDPPYGVGFKYANHKDVVAEYPALMRALVLEAERVASDGAPIMIWQAAKNVEHFSEWFPTGWRLLIAAKTFAQILPGPTWPAFEPIVTWWKGGKGTAYGQMRRDFCLADTSPASRKRRGDEVKGHPCPRPLQHVKWVIDTWCKAGGTVLDPFMGSGTTGVVCAQTGRNFIGIEIDPGYFEIAKRRIEQAQQQAPLLAVSPVTVGDWANVKYVEK